jgi:hypothetical protein
LRQHATVDTDDLVGKVPCLHHPNHRFSDLVRPTDDTQGYSCGGVSINCVSGAEMQGQSDLFRRASKRTFWSPFRDPRARDGGKLAFCQLLAVPGEHFRGSNQRGCHTVHGDALLGIGSCKPMYQTVHGRL